MIVSFESLWLVEQQQLRPERDRHHDLGGALIAVRKLPHEPVAFPREPAQVEELLDAAGNRGPVRFRHARLQPMAGGHLHGYAQVLAYRELGKDLGHLESARHAELHAIVLGHVRDVLPLEVDRARGGRKESADQIEERGLAGAVGTDHRAQLAGADREGDPVDGDELAELLARGAHLENAHAMAFRLSTPSTPRGKKSTTSMKNTPITDIQFSVWLET